ncbi:MAG: hypothetical protein OXR84_13810 [Magnetovibrio sp.]|nr:hypothetical protein [Magnetovibrio sp.]
MDFYTVGGAYMAEITLLEASKLVGKSKQTIQKAVNNGRLSAKKDQNKVYKIDTSELFRVYDPVNQDVHQLTTTKPLKDTHTDNQPNDSESDLSIKLLEMEYNHKIELLELQLSQTKDQLKEKTALLDETKSNLSKKEDHLENLQLQFTNLLTDQSKKDIGLFAKLINWIVTILKKQTKN